MYKFTWFLPKTQDTISHNPLYYCLELQLLWKYLRSILKNFIIKNFNADISVCIYKINYFCDPTFLKMMFLQIDFLRQHFRENCAPSRRLNIVSTKSVHCPFDMCLKIPEYDFPIIIEQNGNRDCHKTNWCHL